METEGTEILLWPLAELATLGRTSRSALSAGGGIKSEWWSLPASRRGGQARFSIGSSLQSGMVMGAINSELRIETEW